ncbi:MAG TPA: hypothetical protein VFS30_01735 [Dehalococcoidia bacterium]|nr:hypothetical protein [Dehalococcoidia bacterium]
MRRRFRWRWLRAKAWRLARKHYMLSFTAIALALAGAGALGYFDGDDRRSELVREAFALTRTPVPTRTPAPTLDLTPDGVFPIEPLTVTYYLVDNERDLHALEGVEDGMIFREILEKDAIEIILIRNEDEQTEANRILEEVEALAEESGFTLVIQDLRD